MKKRRARRLTEKKSKTSMVLKILIIPSLMGIFLLISYLYTTWKQNQALLSLKNEYQTIIAQEEKALRNGDVLSGSTKDKDQRPHEKKIKLPIILYHYVEFVKDENDTIRKSLNINPYIFERQLKDLHDNKYQTYFIKEIPKILRGITKISTRSAVLTFDDGYEDFYTDAFPLLKKYKIKSTLYIVHDFIGRKGFLNKKQISALINSGIVEIGSHAIYHISLSGITPIQADFQLKRSKDILEETFGVEIETFAYPYGGYSDEVVELAKKNKYKAAVSVNPGSYHSIDDLYTLSRYRAGMFGDSMVTVLESLKK